MGEYKPIKQRIGLAGYWNSPCLGLKLDSTRGHTLSYSVVVLEESPCPRESSRTNFQGLVLVLVLDAEACPRP